MTYGIAISVGPISLYLTEHSDVWEVDPRGARSFPTRIEAETCRSNMSQRRYSESRVVDLAEEAERQT